MALQPPPPWGNCISYGVLLACTLKSTNTQLGEFSSSFLCCEFNWDFYMINSILIHGRWYRSDVIEIETWCQGEGRIGTRQDWILKDHATGQVIWRATRCIISYSFFFTSFPLQKRLIRLNKWSNDIEREESYYLKWENCFWHMHH